MTFFKRTEITVKKVDDRYVCEDWNGYWGTTTKIFDTLDEAVEYLKKFFEREK
jgi:hypothetical protein